MQCVEWQYTDFYGPRTEIFRYFWLKFRFLNMPAIKVLKKQICWWQQSYFRVLCQNHYFGGLEVVKISNWYKIDPSGQKFYTLKM
jgi:hypothetical protein